ncbi:hypothetical protein GDO78_008054 [Eleutherodactylus coqui]|uniref:Uncharacterized protein n=1 Tax=Eleutherodactylus coqui TaxID=57060 RepID=A0A8J6K9G9_ELECQ|nr:hypothetical protein GDO78_008054 [Eleutherodactylus coqui]
MAARWGAGEETLTIGGMELFTAGGPLQCHDLEEDETCDGLSDLALSSLDAGGILGTFQGYIDNSIISIIDDLGASAEQKDHFDEENELSLLTALTEILDNADDENISPFDIIPDTELLVSPKDRDGSMTFLALSRTPPEHEMFSVNAQRRADSSKIEGLYSGPNWELFPDIISSTPKRRPRHKSVRGCLPRRAEPQETHQRSDGEDEDVPCLGDVAVNSGLLAVDDNLSENTETDSNDGDPEQILMQRTPCIINTENVALNDLVKYMHPYCLPAITVCLESEDDKNLLSDAVFLEIVSEQGECIKVPVVVEPPVDMLCSESSDNMERMDDKTESLPNHLPSSEECVPELAMHNEKQVDITEKSDEVDPEPMENYGTGPKLPDTCVQPPASDILMKSPDDDQACKSEEIVPDCKKNGEPAITVSVAKEKVPPKGRRSSKDKKPCKSKGKSKTKSITGGKSTDSSALTPVQSIAQPPACRVSNPSLQESDFLTKTLDQVKESQMELRSSKIARTKLRTRESLDGSNPEIKSAARKVKPVAKESEQTNIGGENDKDLESNPKLENPNPEESQDAEVEGLQSERKDVEEMLVASDICSGEEPSGHEESGASKLEDVQDGDSLQLNKETKPKSLSLSEYRKRLQHRKPNPDRGNENQSCSKWPSVPELPTGLAELPCLIVPTHSNKPSVEEKACPQKKHSNVSGQDVPVSSASVPVTVTPTSVANQDVQQLNEKTHPAVVEVAPHPMLNPQPTMPPSFQPPTWAAGPPHPSFYPGMPPLPGGPHYPNAMPLQPPPAMSWAPFPPIAVPPLHPTSWVSGPPTPYWPNSQMVPGMPESQSIHSSPEKSVRPNPHMLSDQKMMQETIVTTVDGRPQPAVLPIVNRKAVPKTDSGVRQRQPQTAAKQENISHGQTSTPDEPQVRPALTSSLQTKADKSQTAAPSASKLANISIPDLKSANQVVIKIMEILKKAQKLGFQLKPSSNLVVGSTQLGVQVPPSETALKPAQPKQTMLADVTGQVVDKSPTEETSTPIIEESSMLEKSEGEPAAGSRTAQKVAEDELAASCTGSKQEPKEPVVPRVETLCTSEESLQKTAESDLKDHEEGFSCDSGIEASDLTSLLEQFEKSEAKEEERLSQSPDKLAVGNSWTEKTLEKKIPDKFLPPELLNTAGEYLLSH